MTHFGKLWDESATPHTALLMAKQPGISTAAAEFIQLNDAAKSNHSGARRIDRRTTGKRRNRSLAATKTLRVVDKDVTKTGSRFSENQHICERSSLP